VSFAAIPLCVASQRVFIVVVHFVIGSVRKLLDTPSYVADGWAETARKSAHSDADRFDAARVGVVRLLPTAPYTGTPTRGLVRGVPRTDDVFGFLRNSQMSIGIAAEDFHMTLSWTS
jgi:hypothetical protein